MLETAGKSLHHSCRTELTRQGISLPLDRYGYSRRLLGIQFIAQRLIILPFQHWAGVRPYTASTKISQSLVFLVNSRYPLFCATFLRFSLFRSYRVNLPSSFNIVISKILVFSTCPPVSVLGTVLIPQVFPGKDLDK